MYLNLPHRADIYTRGTTVAASGQKSAAWTISQTAAKCAYIPAQKRDRNENISQTYGYNENISFMFANSVQADYSSRIYNVTDKYGNVIEAGPIEITSIVKVPGFSGKIHHYQISGYQVGEQ